MMPSSCWIAIECCAEWGSCQAFSPQQRQRLHQHSPFLRRYLCTAGMHTMLSLTCPAQDRLVCCNSECRCYILTIGMPALNLLRGSSNPMTASFAGGMAPGLHSIMAAVSLLQPAVRPLRIKHQQWELH